MRNCYFYSIICGLFLFATTALAQSGTQEKAFYLNGASGFSMPGLDKLNTVVKGAGFIPFNSVYFSRGGGFFTTFPKARLASIFNFSTYSGSKTEGANHNWLRSTQVGTSLGFIASSRTSSFQLIPYAGLAYSFFGARVSGNAATGGNFSSYFQGPANQYHVSNNQFVANVGLHIAKTQLGSSKFGEKLLMGGRFGYYIPLGDGTWKASDVKLNSGPAINAGGFYATLILGVRQ